MSPVISVIVPTYNEVLSIRLLIDRLTLVLAAYDWEIIFVDDDSPDATWRAVKDAAAHNSRVRCLRRVGRRGLAGACIEGMLSSSAPFVAVMDGDLQHDETILPVMIDALQSGNFDIAVGSRHVDGGTSADGFSPLRARASRFALALAQRLVGTSTQDLMSGFFAARRETIEAMAPELYASGFKILLDILATGGNLLRVTEIEYSFRSRCEGDSKFDLRAMWDFFGLLAEKASQGRIPARFVQFMVVGCLGVAVHLAVLRLAMTLTDGRFAISQTIALVAAMTSNFFINNFLTYRDMKLRGVRLLAGLLYFMAICSIGAVSDMGVAAWLLGQEHTWWVSGFAGAMFSAVWNYTVSASLIWRRRS